MADNVGPSERKIIRVHVPGKPDVYLSVCEVMENDGRWCGPEWGWMTLDEIVRRGSGIDTAPEEWDADGVGGEEVLLAMRDYWEAHPEMADEGYDSPQ